MPTGKLRLLPKMWQYSSAGPGSPTIIAQSHASDTGRLGVGGCVCARTGDHREPNEKLDAVVLSAAAWLVSSPTQLPNDLGADVVTHSVRGAFQGLTELTALNRYRRCAL